MGSNIDIYWFGKKIFFQIFPFVFHRRKKVIQVWNDLEHHLHLQISTEFLCIYIIISSKLWAFAAFMTFTVHSGKF